MLHLFCHFICSLNLVCKDSLCTLSRGLLSTDRCLCCDSRWLRWMRSRYSDAILRFRFVGAFCWWQIWPSDLRPTAALVQVMGRILRCPWWSIVCAVWCMWQLHLQWESRGLIIEIGELGNINGLLYAICIHSAASPLRCSQLIVSIVASFIWSVGIYRHIGLLLCLSYGGWLIIHGKMCRF